MHSENDRNGSLNGLTNSNIGMKSLSQSTGMTNGLGGKNGMTNGLGGRTNGMTNGLGGKTNGLGGRTNGMTNGLGGKTNGITNGLGGKTNGLGGTSGLTNGLGGKTNGLGGRTNGMTNGLGSGGPVMRSRRMDDSGISPFRISLIIVIAFMIIVPVSFFMVAQNEAKTEGMHVDGDFSDWTDVSMNSDTELHSVASLDIAKYAVSMNDVGNLYLYAETEDKWMPGQNADSLFVFIDSDGDSATGYSVQGMGAEYVADVYGWQGSIQGSQIGIFSGADQYNWSAWNWRSTEAAMNGTQIEIGIRGPVFTTYAIQPTHSILFLTMRDRVPADICDGKIGIDLPSLTVQMVPQYPNGVLTTDIPMNLVLTAGTSAVEVTAIGIECSGVSSTSVAGIPASIPAGGVVTLEVTAPVTSLANGTFVGMAVTSVTCAGVCTSVLGQPLAAYANSAPNGISIDGAFGDWADISRIADSDNISNPNTDIDRHASVNSTIEAFFYLQVSENGEMLGGSLAPIERSVPETTSEPSPANGTSPPVSVVTPRVTGEDFTRIYIDTEPAGQSINGILADYLLEVTGKGGVITSQKLFSMPGKTFIQDITAGVSGREMEAGVPLTAVGYSGSLQYFIETTDWLQNADRTDAGYSMPLEYSTRSGTDFQNPCSELTVGAGQTYTTIQSAIDAATPGDTIRVWEGTYSENVIVNKTLTITGNGSAAVTIDGGATGDAITIVSDSVDFSGFTVTNVDSYDIYLLGVSNCRIHNNTALGNTWEGITLESSGGNTVEYNTCPSLLWAGIVLRTSDGNTIRNNVVTGNNQGIYLDTSVSNVVFMNNVTLSTGDGIVLDPDSNLNNITFNEVSGNVNTGILMNYANNNLVTQNTIADNGNGLFIETSSGNEVFHNNLITNSLQGYDNNTGSNFWDTGDEGNYWSDYSGTDGDSNGIGDTPYSDIGGGIGAQDNFPLMDFWMPEESQGLTPHDPIRINSDADFTGANGVVNSGTANGTVWNPWIISGWDVNGTSYGYGIYVGNTTDSFIIRNCSIHDITGALGSHDFYDQNISLTLYNVQNGAIENVSMVRGDIGLCVRESPGMSVSECTASFNDAYGMQFFVSSNSQVSGSTIEANYYGLNMYTSDSCEITGNLFTDNDYGIYLYPTTNAIVSDNEFSNNGQGMWVRESVGLQVYHNNFVGTAPQAADDWANQWDNGAEGNYWSDYAGDDADSNGIGDTPHAVQGGVNQDNYPIMKRGGWLPVYNSDTDTYYSNIQEALDDAVAGNTVIISDGLFAENLVIDKPLTIIGDGMSSTTELDAQGGIGIHITSDNATVSDMKIFNGTEGIFIDTVSNASVSSVNSSFNSDYGIHFLASDNSSLTDSIVSENTLGVYIDSSSDIALSNISVHNNTWEGLYLENSQRNTVSKSSFDSNHYGISISAGGSNTIYNSTCSNNDWGVYLDSSSGNLVYGNDFLSNTEHAFDSTGTNMWNATYPLGGNNWGGYTGYDNYSGANQDILGEDGFIDTPYTGISGGMGAQDEYPLIPVPEFRLILLPIIILLGLVVMARKGRSEQSDSEESETDEIADEDSTKTVEDGSEPEDEVPEKKAAGKPEIKRTLLIAGVVLSSLGALGIIGLRAGMVQPMLGYDNPAPGIGSLEMMGLTASAIPLAIGLVTVLVWGARSNPAYFELEKMKDVESKEEVKETETKPAEAESDSAAEEEAEISPEEEPELSEEVIPESEETEKEIPEVAEDPKMIPKAVAEPVPESPAPKAAAKPETPKTPPRDEQAEKIRIERSQKMISYAAVTPEDRERLTQLMESGMPVQKFTEEVKKAVEKRRKMETEAAERKKAEEAARKKRDDEENGRKPVETDEDPFIDDAELEDLLLDEVDN